MRSVQSLLPYQTAWLRDTSGIAVMEKSRRIGISWAEALGAVRLVARRSDAANLYYQSYAKDMTSGFISDCAGWADTIQAAASAVHEEAFEEGGRKAYTYRIVASTGKEILAMTSSPRGFRSKGRPRDVAVLDEAAFVDDLAAVLKAARAFRVWGGRLRVISTHNGDASEFAELCRRLREGEIPGSIHKVTFRDALDQGLYKRICEVAGEEWSPEREQQWEADVRAEYGEDAAEELDCVPASGAGHWLAWPLIHNAEHADAGLRDLYAGGSCYVGVDVARRRDLFVIIVLEEVGDVLWIREMIEARGISFSEQDAILDEVVAEYQPVRIAMDQTGMGEKPVEDAQGRYGSLRVEGVLMTGPRRLDVATAARQVFEDGRMRIPARNRELRADLRSVRTEDGPTGAPRLIVPRTREKGEDKQHGKTHADRFWALALAAAAAAGDDFAYGYEPVVNQNYREPGRLRLRPDHSGDTRGRIAGADRHTLMGRASFGRGSW